MAAGVPARVAVPSPLSVKVTPDETKNGEFPGEMMVIGAAHIRLAFKANACARKRRAAKRRAAKGSPKSENGMCRRPTPQRPQHTEDGPV